MRTLLSCMLAGALCCSAGCYYRAEHRQVKANQSFLSEAEAESLIEKRFEEYGIEPISNMKLKRDGVSFTADGYDRDIRVGFEYRSHEGRDFEDEEGGRPEGLSDAEIEILQKRQDTFREYFLIVPEGTRDEVEQAVKKFIKDLYVWEVLKKPKVTKSKSLFPEKDTKHEDLLPWESTGDLKKKREDMERKEDKSGDAKDDDVWDDDFKAGGKSSSSDSEDDDSENDDKEKTRDNVKGSKSTDDDVWGDEDEDF